MRISDWSSDVCSSDLLVVEPGPQLALLAASEGAGAARSLGPLDESEGLQHGVVEVGGDLGALLGADALATLDAKVATEAEDPRADQETDADAGGHDREADVADLLGHAAGREEEIGRAHV